jgi:Domain of unknown function (DUF4192)
VTALDHPGGGAADAGGGGAVWLRSPAEVVAAVPTLLGFHPVDSVVIIGLVDAHRAGHGDGRVGPVLRMDLPAAPTPGGVEQAVAAAVSWAGALITAVPTHLGLSGAVVMTLAARVPPLVWPLLRAGFGHLHLPVLAGVHAESTHPGAVWMCMCGDPACGVAGVLDGQTSVLEAHAVVAGKVRYPTREQWIAAGRPAPWGGIAPPDGRTQRPH